METHALIAQLTQEQKAKLREALNFEFQNSLEQKVNENPTNCPHCESNRIRTAGKARGVQRYKCKDCSKTFGTKKDTAFHHTKKPLETWNHYLDLMFNNQMSLRKIAKQTGINLRTAFFWRHKILNALNAIQSKRLTGIVEADETYFPLSYKGKKKDMPRESRKRGKQIKKRGISKEQVCVVTAIDRTKTTLLQSTCLGRPTTRQITSTLAPHIARDALLVTDLHRAYPGFARNLELKHYALRHRTSDNETIHLQNINSLHSQVKRFMRPFNGVATKYLDNYMAFYKWSNDDADVAAQLAQKTASVTCADLTAMQMRLK